MGAVSTISGDSDDLRTSWLLGQMVSRLLSAEDTEPPVVVLTDPSSDSGMSSLPVSGLPTGWERRSSGWDQMSGIIGATLAERSKVFVIPPWGRRSLHVDAQSQGGSRSLEGAHLQRPMLDLQDELLLNCPAPAQDVRLCVLLPAATVRSKRTRFVRSAVMKEWQVTDVVFLQGVIANVHPSFECVLLSLRPHGHGEPLTRFFEMDPRADSSSVCADFDRLQRIKGGESELGYVFRGDLEAGANLAYGLRDPRLKARREDLAHFGRTVALEELFEIQRRGLHPLADGALFCAADTPGAVRVVSGKDLTRDGELRKPDTDSRWAVSNTSDVLLPNDVLIQSIVSRSDRRGFTVVQLGSDVAAVASDSLLVARPLNHVPRAIIDFAVAYLRSAASRQLYFAQNRDGLRLGTEFARLTVPVPDEEILLALQNLKDAQKNFVEWADEAGQVIDSIFEFASIKQARPLIIAAGRDVRWRSREARNLDDPDFVVRRAFPYPIAHRWRIMEAALSSSSPSSGYMEILDTAESILAFLAQITIVLAKFSNVEMKALAPIRRKLQAGSGPGMGDWAALLQETTGKHFSGSTFPVGLADIIGMFRNPEVEAARVRLSRRRNDEAHNRRVETADMEEATTSALADLRTLSTAAAFLVDMPLRHVTETSWDSFIQASRVTYREMVGDHWVVRSQIAQVSSYEIESDSLYVVDPDGHWHLLRPFLVVRDCPHCRSISTFHVDAVENGKIRLKSLENGHTIVDSRDITALQQVGLL